MRRELSAVSRIEAFSDSVVAIAITLLVLSLKVPHVDATGTVQELLKALWNIMPELLSFALSFLAIALFWVYHHNFFQTLKDVNRRLMWCNIHLLFWITLIPFTTGLLGQYYHNAAVVMLYSFVLFAASFSFLLMRHSARGHYKEHITVEYLRRHARQGMIAPLCYALAMVMALVSVYAADVVFLLVPVAYLFFSTSDRDMA